MEEIGEIRSKLSRLGKELPSNLTRGIIDELSYYERRLS